MAITLYERISATQSFSSLLNRVINEGSIYQAGGDIKTLKLCDVHTIVDMSRPVVGVKELNYSELTDEVSQLVNQFFESEPYILETLIKGQEEAHFWRYDKFFGIEITFLIRREWVHIKAAYSVCDMWYHFPSDIVNLSLLAAKICLCYYQHKRIKLNLGRLDMHIKRCFVRTDELDIIKPCLQHGLIDTSPLSLEEYYKGFQEEGWNRLVRDLKEEMMGINQTHGVSNEP